LQRFRACGRVADAGRGVQLGSNFSPSLLDLAFRASHGGRQVHRLGQSARTATRPRQTRDLRRLSPRAGIGKPEGGDHGAPRGDLHQRQPAAERRAGGATQSVEGTDAARSALRALPRNRGPRSTLTVVPGCMAPLARPSGNVPSPPGLQPGRTADRAEIAAAEERCLPRPQDEVGAEERLSGAARCGGGAGTRTRPERDGFADLALGLSREHADSGAPLALTGRSCPDHP
jgi:hypothetical protein